MQLLSCFLVLLKDVHFFSLLIASKVNNVFYQVSNIGYNENILWMLLTSLYVLLFILASKVNTVFYKVFNPGDGYNDNIL